MLPGLLPIACSDYFPRTPRTTIPGVTMHSGLSSPASAINQENISQVNEVRLFLIDLPVSKITLAHMKLTYLYQICALTDTSSKSDRQSGL